MKIIIAISLCLITVNSYANTITCNSGGVITTCFQNTPDGNVQQTTILNNASNILPPLNSYSNESNSDNYYEDGNY